jgi:hypothetical protein
MLLSKTVHDCREDIEHNKSVLDLVVDVRSRPHLRLILVIRKANVGIKDNEWMVMSAWYIKKLNTYIFLNCSYLFLFDLTGSSLSIY